MKDTTTPETERRKTGPLPVLDTRLTTVLLSDEMIEWGKRQEGGLSKTIRRLMEQAMDHGR